MLSFIQQLREAEIPISVQYILEFYRGLQKGLAPDLDRLFLLARLVFIKHVEHYDAFERVFARFFLGKVSWQMPDWEEAFAGKPFREWLREQIEKGVITADELREYGSEELLKRFWKTLLEQRRPACGREYLDWDRGTVPVWPRGEGWGRGAGLWPGYSWHGPEGDR